MPSTRHLACLSFDFDAVSLWMAQGLVSPTNLSRGEFGVVGVERILALLARNGIRATFFIPGVTLDTYPDACREIAAAGHEIGHHGFHHESPVGMARADELAALQRGTEAIRRVAGVEPAGYRSPAWDLSPSSVELLLAEGFRYDSSMMAHDSLPYRARIGDRVEDDRVVFGRESELVELPISWSLDDFPHFEYVRGGGLRIAGHVMANWLADFEFMVHNTEWGVLTYTFHPFVIGRGHRMLMLERLIAGLRDFGAEFVTGAEAVDEFCRLET